MERFTNDEISAAMNSNEWETLLKFIEHLENLLMDAVVDLVDSDIKNALTVLAKIISDNNVKLIQRSLKILEAMCNSKYGSVIGQHVEIIVETVFRCASETNRFNIRDQAIRTMNALIAKSSPSLFLKCLSDPNMPVFNESRLDILQLIITNSEILTEEDWKSTTLFVVQCIEDKSPVVKARCQEVIKFELFQKVIQESFDKLTPNQKKLIQPLLDQPMKSVEEIKIQDQTKEEAPHREVISLNTSAFVRNLRLAEMKKDDGLRLLIDSASYTSFFKRLSLDINDVFDDDLAHALLSMQSSYRLESIENLKDIFDSSTANFDNSIDIVLRWCGLQFIGRQITVSQAALSLLLDELINEPRKNRIALQEICFIVPIVLWCIAIHSVAYSNLLQELKKNCSDHDYGTALLISLQLQHNVVVSTVFEELAQLNDIGGLEEQLTALTTHQSSSINQNAKLALSRLIPYSPRGMKNDKDPVALLRSQIQMIKNNPDLVSDSRTLFGSILDIFEKSPTEDRLVRYLLYCTHAFLSEPLLTNNIRQSDFISFIKLFCEFSLSSNPDFNDAMSAIGFVMASIMTNVAFFETIITFIGDHLEQIKAHSFIHQLFSMGISMIAVSQSSNELIHLRHFAKKIIGKIPKDDLRACLCRALLGEIVTIEQQRSIESEQFKQDSMDKFDLAPPVQTIKQLPQKIQRTEHITAKQDINSTDPLEFVHIIAKLGRQSTRSEGIADLISFDERYPAEQIIESVCRIAPSISREIESNRKPASTSSRPSSRTSQKRVNEYGARPSSRSSQRSYGNNSRPSSRSSQKRNGSIQNNY